ncbi:hypothetical protein WAF17_07700 [Bernardetia sp. ABR2-2B]|uniref:hypothetical protein n=1 Tax=Bernardetia sp. ABR2-2B TaxID=3127472 RepID=UPI0030CB16C7
MKYIYLYILAIGILSIFSSCSPSQDSSLSIKDMDKVRESYTDCLIKFDSKVALYKSGFDSWTEKDVVCNLIYISSDSSILKCLQSEEKIALLIVKYVSYETNTNFLIEMKGNNSYTFNATDEEFEQNQLKRLDPVKNNLTSSYAGFSLGGSFTMNDVTFRAQLDTTYYYRKNGYLVIYTITEIS